MKRLSIFGFFILALALPLSVFAQEPPRQPPQNGPYYHQIYFAESPDGLNWTTDNVLLRDHTSVPEVIEWGGALWIYAIQATQPQGDDGVIAMTQQADGSWTEAPIVIADFDGHAVDPDLVILPDGRLRLYFFDFSVFSPPPPPGQQPDPGYIYSAVSEDGIHFTMDAGFRFESQIPATDPDVVMRAKDDWWMFISHGQELVITHSTDGLTFEEVGTTNNGGVSGTVVLEDGRLRQYACNRDVGMVIQESVDGVNWEQVGVVMGIPRSCDPSLIQREEGSWLMVRKEIVQPQ